MTLFAINAENTITTFAAAARIPEGQERFTSEEELFAASTTWPADRLVQIWNSFAGVAGFGADLKPVKKFTDRTVAVARIWKAIQKLDGAATTAEPEPAAAAPAQAPKAAKGARKSAKAAPAKAKSSKTAKAAKKATEAATPREGSKKATVIAMLQRKSGATLEEIMDKMGWQKHTVRGFMSGAMKKAGYTIESTKSDAGRTYRIAK
jgi:hypothetical protein